MDNPLNEPRPEFKPEHREEFHKPEPKVEIVEKEEKKPETKRKDKTPKWMIWSSIIQIVLLIFIAFQISGLDNLAPTGAVVGNQPSQPTAPTPTPIIDMTGLVDDDSVKGDADAPVTIVEFSDYECPFCARFYSQTYGQIVSEYIDTGKVKLIFRDFPLSFHQQAQKAAEAAECAGEQGKYYEMHDMLFEDGVVGGIPTFKGYAQDIGLDTTEFNTCLDSGAMASEVQKDFLDGQKAGVRGTPAFIINGKLVSGAQPFTVFQQVIDAELS